MSLSVTIQQFSGGVTEVAPSAQLVANSNYLWEIMGRWGIQAMRYTGGGGVVAGVGVITGTGKVGYELLVTIPGVLGSEYGATYQHDDLINAVDVNYFFINNQPLQINAGDTGTYLFNYSTGTITLLNSNLFYGQDKLLIPYSRYVNISTSTTPAPPSTTSAPIQFVTTYAEAFALPIKIGYVQVEADETKGGQKSMYAFLADGTLEFQYAIP